MIIDLHVINIGDLNISFYESIMILKLLYKIVVNKKNVFFLRLCKKIKMVIFILCIYLFIFLSLRIFYFIYSF